VIKFSLSEAQLLFKLLLTYFTLTANIQFFRSATRLTRLSVRALIGLDFGLK